MGHDGAFELNPQIPSIPSPPGRTSAFGDGASASAWGSDDPTKAAFPFLHGHALAEAGHEVQISLLGEAVSLMRPSVAKAVVSVGWPPLAEALDKVVAKKIQIYACGACSRARGVTETDLAPRNAKFGNPTIFVGLVEWADRIITE